MYKSKILVYISNTSPDIARSNNTKSGRETIRQELKEEIIAMMSAKETAKTIGLSDTENDILQSATFTMQWLNEFGLKEGE